jgi:secreted trypsin-like serine protease
MPRSTMIGRAGRGVGIALAVALAACLPASPAAAREPVAQASVVNGHPIDISTYPWLGALLNDARSPAGAAGGELERFQCGGSLIAPTIFLTAAHCVTEGDEQLAAPQLHVVFGKSLLGTPGGETVDVTAVVRDPEYARGRYAHDAALLVLSRPVTIAPIPLAGPSSQLREGTTARIAGWGATGEGAPASPQLLGASVPLWSNVRCLRAYRNFIAPHEPGHQLCAAKRRGGVDTCQGDSGGPLIGSRGGADVLLGVVSYGNGCARRGWPGIYTWVASPFIQPWIVRRAAALSSGNPDATAPALDSMRVTGRFAIYAVTEPSEVVVAVQRRTRRGRLTLSTALIQNAALGENRFPVPRKLRGRPLGRGRYVLRATATDAAGNRSRADTASFRIR